jgi:hypothetical protein
MTSSTAAGTSSSDLRDRALDSHRRWRLTGGFRGGEVTGAAPAWVQDHRGDVHEEEDEQGERRHDHEEALERHEVSA